MPHKNVYDRNGKIMMKILFRKPIHGRRKIDTLTHSHACGGMGRLNVSINLFYHRYYYKTRA